MRKETVFYWCMLLFKWIQKYIVDPILDYFGHYTTLDGSRTERLVNKKYETSAQRVKVLARGTYCVPAFHMLHNFFYTHIEYIHPKQILESDSTTLMVRKIVKKLILCRD